VHVLSHGGNVLRWARSRAASDPARAGHLSDGQNGRCYGHAQQGGCEYRGRGSNPIPRFGSEERNVNAERGKTEATTEHAGTATPDDSFKECRRRFPEEAA